MPNGLIDLILTHVQRYPALEAVDVYRLLHHAVFGSGSPVGNKKAAREWLDHEAKLARPDPGKLLTESVHPTGEVIRVHLGPYQALGGSLPALLDAFIKSAETVPGDVAAQMARMAESWQTFAGLIAPDGALAGKFEARTIALMGRVRAAESWAAAPHSSTYLHHYHPYYRVLLRAQGEQLMRRQSLPFQPS